MTTPRRPPKKPYAAPRLQRYGDLRTLTRGAKSTKVEGGGAAKTKLTGGG